MPQQNSRVRPSASATTITGYTYDVALDTPIYAQLPHRRKPVLPRWYQTLSYRNSKADSTTKTWVPTTCSDLASLTSAGINRLEHRPQTEAHSLCLGRGTRSLQEYTYKGNRPYIYTGHGQEQYLSLSHLHMIVEDS